ncbi:hypothetical protein D6779_00085 [Candidatus Parcubacteria bacterium]|nr:MAG: hypothetical protein D6779_00085 [Candidatus Parcubacteria bacterium]
MALPQKAIDQLSRAPVRMPGWSSKIIMFGGTLFFLSIAIYFGVRYGYIAYLNGQIEEVKKNIAKLEAEVKARGEDEDKVINFYSQIANLSSILDDYKYGTLALPWLEFNTQRNVEISSFSADITQGEFSIDGRGRTVDDIAQQVASFEQSPEIAEVQFDGSSRDDEGFWSLQAKLRFKEGFFKNDEAFRAERVRAPQDSQGGNNNNNNPNSPLIAPPEQTSGGNGGPNGSNVAPPAPLQDNAGGSSGTPAPADNEAAPTNQDTSTNQSGKGEPLIK